MTIWLPQLRRERPLYLEIAEAIRQDTLSGALKPGDRLPPQRDLAFRLGVTTGTVTRAYAEAEKMGLVAGEVGRGSFIKAPGAQAKTFQLPSAANERRARPLPGLASASARRPRPRLRRCARSWPRPAGSTFSDYTAARGLPAAPRHGGALAGPLRHPRAEQDVVVTAGAHAAIIAMPRRHQRAGDKMFVEGLNYCSLKPIARHLGITLVPLEMDQGGLVPDALERAARAGEARLLYIVPTLQNPTTARSITPGARPSWTLPGAMA